MQENTSIIHRYSLINYLLSTGTYIYVISKYSILSFGYRYLHALLNISCFHSTLEDSFSILKLVTPWNLLLCFTYLFVSTTKITMLFSRFTVVVFAENSVTSKNTKHHNP